MIKQTLIKGLYIVFYMEESKPICPNCFELRGMEIELEGADYSKGHLVCPECDDEFDKEL